MGSSISTSREQEVRAAKRCPAMQDRRGFLAGCCLGPCLVSSLAAQVPRRRSLFETVEDRVSVALMLFKSGFHCSQSVLEAYAEDFDLEPDLARRMAAGLAGGSTVGGECGAVSVGYLVLGMRHARDLPSFGDVERERELFGRIERFVAEFKKRHGAIACRELLGVDVLTAEGRAQALREDLFMTRCVKQIRDAIEILEELG